MWRDAIRFERRHWLDTGCGYFVGWQNKEFFPVPLDEKRLLYVATPLDWKIHEPCRALAVPSSPLYAYKSNATVDDDTGTPGKRNELYTEVALADHTVMVIMQFLKRAWPWSRDRIEKIPGYDPRMVEGGHVLLFTLPERIAERIRHVGINRIVSGTRYSPVRALAAVLCSLGIFWGHPDVLGWYLCDFTTGDVYAVPPRATHRGKDCPGSEPRSQFGIIAKNGADRMAAVTERVKVETDRAAAEERERWDRSLKAKAKGSSAVEGKVAERAKDSRAEVPSRALDGTENVTEGAPVVVIEDSVAPGNEMNETPVPVGTRSLQVPGDW